MAAQIFRQTNISEILPILFLASLFIFSSLPISVAEEEPQSYFSANYIQGIIDSTPAPNPSILEHARSNSNTITVSGTIPRLAKGNESYNWFVLLQGVLGEVNAGGQLEPYLWDNGGFIIGYGSQEGHVKVIINDNSAVTDEEINQVIQIFTDAGKEYGINDIPVILEKNTHAQGFVQGESASPKSPDEIKTIPGVGLYICALLVVATALITYRFKK